MITFVKQPNIRKINYARREFHKSIERLNNPVEYPITNIEGIRDLIFMVNFDFPIPEIKEYYFCKTREPFRIDSYLIFDENKFRFQKGFARGMREISKDHIRILSERSL